MEVLFVLFVNIIFFLIMKISYRINPWEINKMVTLWNRSFGGMRLLCRISSNSCDFVNSNQSKTNHRYNLSYIKN